MAVFKCKMCGASLEAPEGATTATCGHCRTAQTLPKVGDDRRANLYDRAGHFRRANEYDKAMRIYEQVLADDPTDAEAYWSVVLCRYGIEYVEDPATKRRVPTVNRMQASSVLADPDYKAAVEHADVAQRGIYEAEARAIAAIQEGISEVAAREEPFDVFICYKETDGQGRRTRDSVLAAELYHELVHEGFRVFFSRITLEDKLGSAYEPYIFAALQSAKVMVVLGTSPGHFSAVWVKNEWSRFLALIQGGARKALIPAYRDMDPYDLPEEFAHLQAQDMSKLGFMQDLVRGIKKIVSADAPGSPAPASAGAAGGAVNANNAALLERAQMALEDGEWGRADEFCEQVLNYDARNAEAYLYKLMAQLHVSEREGLRALGAPFDGIPDYQKAVRFGDDGLREFLEDANRAAGCAQAYSTALSAAKGAQSKQDFDMAAQAFEALGSYRDARVRAKALRREWARIEAVADDIVRTYGTDAQAAGQRQESLSERRVRLIAERDSRPHVLSQLSQAQQAVAPLEQHLAELQTRRSSLGFFAFEQKRELEGMIAAAGGKLAEARAALQQAQRRAEALRDPAALSTELAECERLMAEEEDAARRRASMGVGDIHHTEADLRDPRVMALVKGAFSKMPVSAKLAHRLVLMGLMDGELTLGTWGGEPMRWRVLARQDGKALVVTTRAVDARRFDSSSNEWGASELKRWLEGEFLRGAFGDAERKTMASRPFCLSVDEARQLFRSNEDRVCVPTAYAKKQGAYTSISNSGACLWWLRSPGVDSYYAAIVRDFGSVFSNGDLVGLDYIGVRPALWLNL